MLLLSLCAFAASARVSQRSEAFLVESIPTDTHLPLAATEQDTWVALINLTASARTTLDIGAMYWNLLADDLTAEEYVKFGAGRGKQLYDAIWAAAKRGVNVRVVQGEGISSDDSSEWKNIQKAYPDNFEVRLWSGKEWYGGGIQHMKFWVADSSTIYVGSANMDWLSLTQVKEMGVVVRNNKQLGGDITKLFNRWWEWSHLKCESSVRVFDRTYRVNRTVPCWSYLVPYGSPFRCKNPLNGRDGSTISHFNMQVQY
jgi:phospholipase D3/4